MSFLWGCGMDADAPMRLQMRQGGFGPLLGRGLQNALSGFHFPFSYQGKTPEGDGWCLV